MNEPRPVHPAMRWLLAIAAGFVFIAGVPLFLLATDTQTWFAWTIDPPLTAATLGACYWAAGLIELRSAHATSWANARVAVPGVLLFTTLTNLPTLQNVDSFHLDMAQAWVWIGTYLLVPPLLAGAWYLQAKVPGGDPPRDAPLQPVLRAGLGALAAGFLTYGAALMFAPEAAGAGWPWPLNPAESTYQAFTEPYLGAWLLGLGAVAGQATWENDHGRVAPVFPAMLLLGLLQAIALARYGAVLDATSLSGAIYLAGVAYLVVLGGLGMALRPRGTGAA